MKIGKLEKVELREVWENEAKDFTTWLYENLDALSDAIDLTLVEPERERKVEGSRFSIDILAETDDNEGVIIENQLEQSDHKHLGQIITYLINMDCSTAIWIVKEPRQEHINAINWLNEATEKCFYLVKLEAYKIGDSKPAPFFSVICQPTEDTKVLGKEKKQFKEELHEKRERRQEADCLIIPARKEGFEKVFIGQDEWYAVRIGKDKISQLKWIAAYQVAPVSAITHIAKIKEIVPYQDSGKYLIKFDGPASKIKPIPLGENSSKAPQGPIYVDKESLVGSKNIEDALATNHKKAA